ncbi:THAP domain-containing protein 6-like [Carassius gibelio]|uniref:THAP domain-containing protein 6-like n=1 Tax=Carassius gibelio TaxID=101364 RepID=UPI0022790517|nr:THAP domain-containing protein 6-like [Carassius gibelio]
MRHRGATKDDEFRLQKRPLNSHENEVYVYGHFAWLRAARVQFCKSTPDPTRLKPNPTPDPKSNQFPSDTGLRKQWKVAIRRKGFVVTESSKLCSEHFKPDDFDRMGQIVRLRDGATPSVFNFPCHLQRDHSYALPNSPTRLKARLTEALARVESLEREKQNAKTRERRAKKTVKSLLVDLKEKELNERLGFHSGKNKLIIQP